MEEKEVIRGELYNYKNFVFISTLALFLFFVFYMGRGGFTFILRCFIILGIPYFLVSLFICTLLFGNREIIVTSKKVYGKTGLIRQKIELPLDSISSVGEGAFSTVLVATSSGTIKFSFIKNSDEVFKAISKLLANRQDKKDNIDKSNKKEVDTVDEIKKYKKLLDDGIITQEEFDKKKKKLLDL